MAAAQAAAEAALQAERDNTASGEAQSALEPSEAVLASLLAQQGDIGVDPSEAALASLLHQEDSYGDSGLPQHLLAEIMAAEGGGTNRVEELLLMIAEQERHEKQLAAMAALASRPEEHYFSIAQNGMILGATETATGIPADNLLMTSAYDTVYDQDLPGLLAVKSHFWDKGRPEVQAYIRRQTLEGEWIWLASNVESYVDDPVPGMVLLETRVSDENRAAEINRLTRIASILVQAYEAGRLLSPTAASGPLSPSMEGMGGEAVPSIVMDDMASYQSWLRQVNENPESASGEDDAHNVPLSTGRTTDRTQSPSVEQSKVGDDVDEEDKAFDPLAVMKSVRSGIRLDLGMIKLSVAEVKMMVLVLSGRIKPEALVDLVLRCICTPGRNLNDFLHQYLVDHPMKPDISPVPANVSVLNLSYTYLGNGSADLLREYLSVDSPLRTVDISFCGLEEKGCIALARGITKRKMKRIPALEGLILSGNHITYKAAKELGQALSLSVQKHPERTGLNISARRTGSISTGYDEDSESLDELDDSLDELEGASETNPAPKGRGLQVLHIASSSLKPEALSQLLVGLGQDCPIRELSIHSNMIGPAGASFLVDFLEGKRSDKNVTVMPNLDRLDLSNNELGNEGCTKLTRAIAKRAKVQLVDLRLSANEIGHGGIETMMNKLLQHNLLSLSLDKNSIGDQGCQLIAASLQSMNQLARLNLGFNQIGSLGVNTLMKSLTDCESMTYLGLSGNVMKISGAIAMGFTLAQHPRLEELDLYNCCLSQAAQCHIVAGIISNRWVPMKRMVGFDAGPPMVAIGALDAIGHSLSNEECFRVRRDEQMKTILQWMESNRAAKLSGQEPIGMFPQESQEQYLTPDFVSSVNDVQGTPSQNAYLRMLGWLSKIPFDEDELTSLRNYFYDLDGGEGDRGSDGYINLKVRGDLLAALDSDVADELRDALPLFGSEFKGSIGLDLDSIENRDNPCSTWDIIRGFRMDPMPDFETQYTSGAAGDLFSSPPTTTRKVADFDVDLVTKSKKRRIQSSALLQIREERIREERIREEAQRQEEDEPPRRVLHGSVSAISHTGSERSSDASRQSEHERKANAVKARITLFPEFETKLDELKNTARDMIDYEDDPAQQDIILTQYAEASLTILRQLRYHCMNSGLDGWRVGGLKRKVLVVDDSRVTRKLVSRAFEKANFIVDTAENGVEGVAKLKESIYDIAFMDIDMPVMNGFEATKTLRQWEDVMRPGARQPICALTAAYVDDFEKSELLKFKEAGLDVMESKPCNIPRLFKVVDDVSPMFSDLSISRRRQTLSGI